MADGFWELRGPPSRSKSVDALIGSINNCSVDEAVVVILMRWCWRRLV